MGKVERQHELVLEVGIHGQLDTLNGPNELHRLATFVAVEQRDTSAVARGVTYGVDVGDRGVGDHPENERLSRVDVGAERPGENDLIRSLDPRLSEQNMRRRIQG